MKIDKTAMGLADNRRRKLALLKFIQTKKSILFASSKDKSKVSKHDKMEAWKSVLAKAQSLGLTSTNRHWTYARDHIFGLWKSRTMRKLDSRKNKGHLIDAVDYLMLDIIGNSGQVGKNLDLVESDYTTFSENLFRKKKPNVSKKSKKTTSSTDQSKSINDEMKSTEKSLTEDDLPDDICMKIEVDDTCVGLESDMISTKSSDTEDEDDLQQIKSNMAKKSNNEMPSLTEEICLNFETDDTCEELKSDEISASVIVDDSQQTMNRIINTCKISSLPDQSTAAKNGNRNITNSPTFTDDDFQQKTLNSEIRNDTKMPCFREQSTKTDNLVGNINKMPTAGEKKSKPTKLTKRVVNSNRKTNFKDRSTMTTTNDVTRNINKKRRISNLKKEYLEIEIYKNKLQVLQLERDLKLSPSIFTKDLIHGTDISILKKAKASNMDDCH